MLESAKSMEKNKKLLQEYTETAKLNSMISQAYIYELLLKPHGITLEEAERPVKPLTSKEVQKSLITGKTPKKLFIRLYQRHQQKG
ncbi:hypothetical protein [Megamonas funiformis]|jgi:hypothetical protein|uniref:hypothetical protein n=1 Tax=Megamonas funiformis TaxID=437897 RepID=UPI002062260B|nr:hypothetical protein [Megamonas funiformis]DAO66729.1 MAG TPA: hypothetical protein [Caudoviricetes sp.]